MPTTRRHLLTLAALTGVSGLLLPAGALAQRVTGSGNMVTETRPASGFVAVALEASFTVKVRQSGREALSLTADDNLLPLIEAVVETRSGRPTLVLRWKRHTSIQHRSDIVATVDAATVEALATSGSGTVEADAVQGESLKLAVAGSGDIHATNVKVASLQASVAGSGDISATGSTAVLKVSIAGSGDVDTRGVEAEEVKVSIAGSGDAKVTANASLSVSIAGSGDVRYRGRVNAVKTSIVGSGDVTRE